MKKPLLSFIILTTLLSLTAFPQEMNISLPMLNEPVSNFQLADQNGKQDPIQSPNG